MQALTLTAGWIIVIFVGAAGLKILWKMMDGTISLEKLISEDDGTASLSRFQFLVFTFVIAMSLFLVIVGQDPPAFPTEMPPEILALLGISGGSYVISKGIQKTSGGGAGKGAGSAGGAAVGAGGASPGGASGGKAPGQGPAAGA